MRYIITLFILFVSSQSVFAEIQGKEVKYDADGVRLHGYLAYDDSIPGKRPGILVVHEWWGHNEYARKRARMLAEMGYIALAVDMYGEGKNASHPKEAGEFSGEVRKNIKMATARFNAAKEFLIQQANTDGAQLAAIGYCFGGGVVLDMARNGADLKGVVSFHGALNTDAPAEKGKVKSKVLVLHGADDKFISDDVINGFKSEMKNADVDLEFVAYPGAVHAFTNPQATEFGKKFNIPLAYQAEADRLSWTEMQVFLNKLFIK